MTTLSEFVSDEPDPDFDIGDQVIDREDDEGEEDGIMRVIDPNEGVASEVEKEGQVINDYDDNRDYPDDDIVVLVAYETELNRKITDWKDKIGANFRSEIEAFCDEWGIPFDTYSYPESRIKSITPDATNTTADEVPTSPADEA